SPAHFVATGRYGSVENNTRTSWDNSYQVFTGTTTRPLDPNEGVTVGIRFPQGFLTKQDYTLRGVYWLLLPAIVFLLMYLVWKRWGKDDPVTVRTEYYPPDNISPAISGYMIDGMLNRRDLTALVPYWGAGGYLQVREVEDESFFGLVKNKEYEFIKLKELPDTAPEFEKTMFHGIFKTGDQVMLKDLKDELYKAMAEAKKELEREINRREYYVKGSRGFGVFLVIAGLIVVMAGVTSFDAEQMWRAISIFLSAAIMLFFGVFMAKRTKKGTALYQQLAGFREFIRSVERDRLKEFLKQDEHYFDKILPYAIVFNVADTWKDKLEGLDVPPPNWYHGSYAHFSTGSFMHSLHNSMNSMSDTFYSSPSGSGSSGGSFGGGGSSGGGFGGGGGSSW
ncbi:MAG TPA: DUF2207 domain-containing protein, partial [Chitinophagaceae bacterium]|nr:DUF2207 domain-containing protein [Chitinophagaceae bacterium]